LFFALFFPSLSLPSSVFFFFPLLLFFSLYLFFFRVSFLSCIYRGERRPTPLPSQ
jgi:hypothetical protein